MDYVCYIVGKLWNGYRSTASMIETPREALSAQFSGGPKLLGTLPRDSQHRVARKRFHPWLFGNQRKQRQAKVMRKGFRCKEDLGMKMGCIFSRTILHFNSFHANVCACVSGCGCGCGCGVCTCQDTLDSFGVLLIKHETKHTGKKKPFGYVQY